jgi:hypothetical protein
MLMGDDVIHSSHHWKERTLFHLRSAMEPHEKGVAAALLPAALAGLIAYITYAAIYNVFFHPLAKFPGPPIARITIYWKGYVECIQNRSFCHVLAELHAKHGTMTYHRPGALTWANTYRTPQAMLFA